MRTVIQVQQKGGSPSSLLIFHQGLYQTIPLSAIVHIESSGRYCCLYLRAGEQVLTCQKIKTLTSIIGQFWRVGRWHLVNPVYVEKSVGIVRHQGRLRLTNGILVPVSRRQRGQVVNQLRELTR